MHVRAKRKSAVLHIKGKTEDFQVAGRDEAQHPVPADVTRVVHVDVRTRLGNIVIHTGGDGIRQVRRITDLLQAFFYLLNSLVQDTFSKMNYYITINNKISQLVDFT